VAGLLGRRGREAKNELEMPLIGGVFIPLIGFLPE